MKTGKSNKIFNIAVSLTEYAHERVQEEVVPKPQTANVFRQ